MLNNIISLLSQLSLCGKSYFVGGVSRDISLHGKIITKDIDITTSADIQNIVEIINKQFDVVKIVVNEKYGNVRFSCKDYTFDITKARIDKISYGRGAEIEYTNDFKIDSMRRDFTINAILVDKDSNVLDYHNGVSDLKNGVVRFIGDPQERVTQDYTRILRYFRFTALFKNYKHNTDITEIMLNNAHKLREISPIYIKNELLKAIFYDNSHEMFGAVTNLGIDMEIFGCKINQNFQKIINIARENGMNPIYPLMAIVDELSKDDLMRMEISKKYIAEFDKMMGIFGI